MSIKKIFFVVSFLAVLGLVFSQNVPSAQALTSAEIQELIAKLQQQIADLQKQLVQSQQQPTAWCYDFNTNLRIGDSGSGIAALQTALKKEGLLTNITNEFDEETASAVVEFQEKYISEILSPFGLKRGTGFVGPSTRAKLNKLFGCDKKVGIPTPIPIPEPSPTPKPSITVLSPNGGEIWQIGSTYRISWDGENSNTGIYLFKWSTRDLDKANGYANPVKIISPNILPGNINQYYWTIPSDLSSGDYYIRLTDSKSGDNSDNYFSIAAATPYTLTLPAGEWVYFSVPVKEGLAVQTAEGKCPGIDIFKYLPSPDNRYELMLSSAVLQPGVGYSTKLISGFSCSIPISGTGYNLKEDSIAVKPNIYYLLGSSYLAQSKDEIAGTCNKDRMWISDPLTSQYLTTLEPMKSYWLRYTGEKDCTLGAPLAIGSLTLAPNPSTPPAQTIVKGTSDFTFLKADFSASSVEDVKVTSVKVRVEKDTFFDPATSTDIVNIKLFDGATQIGLTQPTVSLSGFAIFSNLNWIITKGSIKQLEVRADVPDTTTASTLRITLVGENVESIGLTSGASIFTNGFVAGNVMTIAEKSITVLSPNGGEQWVTGGSYKVSYKTLVSGSFDGAIEIYLKKGDTILGKINPKSIYEPSTYNWSDVLGFPKYYPGSIVSGNNISLAPPGNDYKIKVELYEGKYGETKVAEDESDNYFSIVAGVTEEPATPVYLDTLNLPAGQNVYFSIPIKEGLTVQTAENSCPGIDIFKYLPNPDNRYELMPSSAVLQPGTGYWTKIITGSACSIPIAGTGYNLKEDSISVKPNIFYLLGSSYFAQSKDEIAGTCDKARMFISDPLTSAYLTALEPMKSYWLKYTGSADCRLGSAIVSLNSAEDQLASISAAINQLIESARELLKR